MPIFKNREFPNEGIEAMEKGREMLEELKNGKNGKKKETELDKAIEKALKDAPKIYGYTIEELAKIADEVPGPTDNPHLELCSKKRKM